MPKKITNERFARIYGVSLNTWRRWMKEKTFPGGLDPAGVHRFVGAKKNRPKNMRAIEEVADMIEEEIGTAPDLSETDELSGIELEKSLKLRAERQMSEHKLKIARNEVIEKTEHCSIVAELVELLFASLEQADEEMAEAWEGKTAVQILQGRKNERDKIRNEIANALEE